MQIWVTIELEAMISRRLPKDASKYEVKLHLKYFSCNKIGHFSSRCLERVSKKPFKPYKSKFLKKCYFYIDEGVTDDKYKK